MQSIQFSLPITMRDLTNQKCPVLPPANYPTKSTVTPFDSTNQNRASLNKSCVLITDNTIIIDLVFGSVSSQINIVVLTRAGR